MDNFRMDRGSMLSFAATKPECYETTNLRKRNFWIRLEKLLH